MPTRAKTARSPLLLAVAGLAMSIPAAALAQGEPLEEPFPPVLHLVELDGQIGFRLEGIADEDRCGYSVGALGDINGDGVDDVIIGSPYADAGGLPAAGEAYIVFGTTAGFPAALFAADLDGSNGLTAHGELGLGGRGVRAGFSVAGASDLNGDGIADAIIGARNAGFDGGYRVGKTYVVFGRGDGAFGATLALAALDGDTGFVANGNHGGDASGASVSSAGDPNGDGIDDVIIGAPGGGQGDPDCRPGESYVVFGRDVPGGAAFPAEFSLGTLGPSTGFRMDGEGCLGASGHSVSLAGDVNGDGLDDVIVGAHEVGELTPVYTGASYVVFGRSAGIPSSIDLRSLDGTNGFRMSTPTESTQSGRSVDSAGDVNGDGIDDVIIGSSQMDSFVVFGRTDGFPADIDLNALDGSDGFQLVASGYSGWAVASAGDMNGDGIDDIAISDYSATTSAGAYAGSVYVVFGSTDGFPPRFEMSGLDGSNGFRIDGSEPGDSVGHAVSPAGDVNGDGADDLIIGTFDPRSATKTGRAFVVFGRSQGCKADLDGDGALTIFDFLEFQNLFDAGDPIADFDGDGEFTIFDFLAFQNAFDAGCE